MNPKLSERPLIVWSVHEHHSCRTLHLLQPAAAIRAIHFDIRISTGHRNAFVPPQLPTPLHCTPPPPALSNNHSHCNLTYTPQPPHPFTLLSLSSVHLSPCLQARRTASKVNSQTHLPFLSSTTRLHSGNRVMLSRVWHRPASSFSP